jgi:hypothetical protein
MAGPDGITYHVDKHLEKIWLADGFDFTGYDAIYIAETVSEAKPKSDEEAELMEWARRFLREELITGIQEKKVFGAVVTRQSGIKPGANEIKLGLTIVEYSRGAGGSRYFTGLWGAGQPVIRVRGRMSAGDKPLFLFDVRRSGVSAGAHLGAFVSNQVTQSEDIIDLTKDVAEFIERKAKHLPDSTDGRRSSTGNHGHL